MTDQTCYVVTLINTSMFSAVCILTATYKGKENVYKHTIDPVSRYAYNLGYVPEAISLAFDYYSEDK